jgi:uncharacterized protein YndB with AHSA1/START domain
MPSAERTLTIYAPIEKVFAFFTNPENDPQWRTELVDVKPEGPPAVGTIVRQTVAGPAGIGQVAADTEFTAYDPPNSYAFKVIAGPVRPQGSFTCTEVEGGTAVTMKLAADIKGPQKFVFSKPAQSAMNATMAALDKAKAILEG